MLPILSTRWSLNYAQAGALFPVQYVASTVAVAVSGVLVSRFGFRFAIRAGLFLIAAGLALLMAGAKPGAPLWAAAPVARDGDSGAPPPADGAAHKHPTPAPA